MSPVVVAPFTYLSQKMLQRLLISTISTLSLVATLLVTPAFTPPAQASTLQITTPTAGLLTTLVGCNYSLQLSASGGTGDRTYSVVNSGLEDNQKLPLGLTLTTERTANTSISTGVISGIPNTAGQYTISVTVTDQATPTPATAATSNFTINVVEAVTPLITKVESTANSATLNWCGVSAVDSAPVTDYEIEYSIDAGSTWNLEEKDASTTPSYTIVGLSNESYGKTFTHYRIRAVTADPAKKSAWSAVVIGNYFSCLSDPAPGNTFDDLIYLRFESIVFLTQVGCTFTYSYPGISPDYGSTSRTGANQTYTFDPAVTVQARLNSYRNSAFGRDIYLTGSSSLPMQTAIFGPVTNASNASTFSILNYSSSFSYNLALNGCTASASNLNSYINAVGFVSIINHSSPTGSCRVRIDVSRAGYQTSSNTTYLLPSTGGYTVVFNPNSGSGMPIPNISAETATSMPSNTTFSRNFYTFDGWNTNVSGTGTNYQPGDPYPFTESVILFAKWNYQTAAPIITEQPKSRSRNLSNSAEFRVDTNTNPAVSDNATRTIQWQRKLASDSDWVDIPSATSTTYTVTGVDDTKTGLYRAKVTHTKNSTSAVTFSNSARLYLTDPFSAVDFNAKAEESNNAIWLDLNTGDNGLVPSGFTFPGWNSAGKYFTFSGDDRVYRDGPFTNPFNFGVEIWFRTTTANNGKIIGLQNLVTDDATEFDRHFYVDTDGKLRFGMQYGANKYTIVSDERVDDGNWHHAVASRASGSNSITMYLDGVAKTLVTSSLNQSYVGRWVIGGGPLTGWEKATANQNFIGDIGLVRVFSPALTEQQAGTLRTSISAGQTVGLTLNSNFGTPTTDQQVVNLNSAAAINANPFTRNGYTFAGWTENSDGTGTEYEAGGNISLAKEKTIYAKWNPNPHNVNFDVKGGSAVTASSFVTDGEITAAPTPPTRSGFTFAGWSATDGGSPITFPFAPGVIGDITLFALWTSVPASGGGNPGGGGGFIPPVVVVPPKQTPTTPVQQLTGGGSVTVTPGKGVAIVDGAIASDSIQIIQNEVKRLAVKNIAVEVKSIDTSNQVKPVTPNLVMQFEQAGNANVLGSGFRATSVVVVWLLSTPTKLGEVVVKADGSFDASMLIPPDFPVGEHTLQVNGVSADNEVISATMGVVVVPKPTPEAPAPVVVKKQVLNLSFFPTQTSPERKQGTKIRNLVPQLKSGDVVTCKAFTTNRSASQLQQAKVIAKRLCAPIAVNSTAKLKFNSKAPNNASQLAWAKRKPIRVQVFVKGSSS